MNTLNRDPNLPPLSPLRKNGEEYFFAGIDMLHSLHCLNALRKDLNPDFQDHIATIAPEMRQLHLGEAYITFEIMSETVRADSGQIIVWSSSGNL